MSDRSVMSRQNPPKTAEEERSWAAVFAGVAASAGCEGIAWWDGIGSDRGHLLTWEGEEEEEDLEYEEDEEFDDDEDYDDEDYDEDLDEEEDEYFDDDEEEDEEDGNEEILEDED